MALLKANTGIGTTNPTSALHVIGDVLVTGVVTATTFNGNINTGVATITKATITDLNNTYFTSGISTITTINNTNINTSGVGTITTLRSGSGIVTTLSGTNLAYTNGNIVTGVVTTISGTSLNYTGVGTITNFNSTTATITDLNNTYFVSGISTITDLHNTRLTSGLGTITTFNSTNSTITFLDNTNINSIGVVTSTRFSTGATGTGINITSGSITGPSTIIIDPAGVGDDSGAVRIKGDLYVDGTQFVVNSSTIELADLRVGIATTVGTNILLDGGGIGIGSTNIIKTFTYNYSSDSLKSSENLDLASGKVYKINGTEVLSATQLTVANINASGISTIGIASISQLLVTGVSTFTGLVDANGGAEIDNIQIGITDDNTIDTSTGGLTLDSNSGTVTINDQVIVAGVTTFNSNVDLDQALNVDGNVTVTGLSTFVGVGTFSNDLYVGGDLYIKDDLFLDELTTRNLTVTGITTVGVVSAISVNATGIITASSFRPSSGYIQAADGTNSFYIYNTTGNVAFQGTIGASSINNASGYQAINFGSSSNPAVLIPNGLNVTGVSTLASAGGITTTGGDLYVGGDLYINDDLFLDELNSRNINVTGIGTVVNLNSTTANIATGNIVTGVVTTISGTSLNYTGVGTITNFNSTTANIATGNIVTGVVTTISGTNLNYTGVGTITTLNSTFATLTNIDSTGITTVGIVTAKQIFVSGVTTSTGGFVGALTGIAASATQLVTPRTFEITGDVVASPIFFDGTGNVSLAATIQPNSVALGTDTTGDYVQTVSGTAAQITVTGGTGESSTPVISIANNPTLPGNVTIANDLQVNNNLNVTGNITIGGTSAYIITNDFRVKDADIVLGFTTNISGQDVSNDTTANHGGIAIASTEGTPLINLTIAGIETLPATYKKIMWFKAGEFAGLGTDAWISNYAIGIGSTQFPSGTRLAAGAVQFTENDLAVVRDINASGIVTAATGKITTLNSTTANILTGLVTSITGTNLNYTGVSTVNVLGATTLNVSGVSTFVGVGTFSNDLFVGGDLYVADDLVIDELNSRNINVTGVGTVVNLNVTTANIATGHIVTGVVTSISGTNLNYTGVGTIATLNSTTGSITTLSGTNLAYTNGNIVTGVVTTISGTNLNYVGVGTIATFNSTTSNLTTANITNANIVIGIVTTLSGTNLNYVGVGTIATLNSTTGSITNLSGTNVAYTNANVVTGIITDISGTNLNYTGVGTITTLNSTTSNLTTANITNANIVTGIVTTLSGTNLNYVGVGTIATLNSTTGSIATLSGTNVAYTNGNIVTGIITDISGTNLNYTGVGTITTLNSTTGNITTLNSTNANVVTGIVTNLSGTNLNYTGVGTIATLNSTTGTITNLSGTNINYTGIATFATLNVVTVTNTNINATGVITASQFSTGPNGIGINTDTISGPAVIYIDPAAVGDNTGAVRIKGDFYVDGTQTVINSQTIDLADFRIGIGTTATNDIVLDGAGIGIGSASNQKTFVWNNASSSLKSSENLDIASGKTYKINGTDVLSSTTLGSGVVNSSLTSVGTLGQLQVTGVSTFTNGPVLIGSGTSTGTASQPLQVTGGAYVSGSVGIGTTLPRSTYKLDIIGDVNFDGNLFQNNTKFVTGVGIGSTNINPGSGVISQRIGAGFTDINIVGTGLSITGYGSTVVIDFGNLGGALSISTSVTSVAQDLTFVGGATTSVIGIATITDRLVYVPSTGRVGVGTSAPAFKLDVVGDINSSTALKVGGVNILDEALRLSIAFG